MNLPERIGVVLRRYRYKKQMDQIDVAVAADCSRSFLSKVENGRTSISLEMFIRLCEALDGHPSDLLREITMETARKRQ